MNDSLLDLPDDFQPSVFTDFIVLFIGSRFQSMKQLPVSAVSSYQAKLVAQQHWKLPNTCDLEVCLATPDGKLSPKILRHDQ